MRIVALLALVGCGGVIVASDDAAVVDAAKKEAGSKDASVIDAGSVLDGEIPSQCNVVPQVAKPIPWNQTSATEPPWPGANGSLPLGYFVVVSVTNYDGQNGPLGTLEETVRITSNGGGAHFDINSVYPMPLEPPNGFSYDAVESAAGTLTLTMTCPGTDAPTWLYRLDGANLVIRMDNVDEELAPL